MTIRHYQFEFTLGGPVHIGNGRTYGKKDYFQSKGKIAILDVRRFIRSLSKEQFKDYCSYLSNKAESFQRMGLQDYLEKNHLINIAEKSIAYYVDSLLSKALHGSVQYHNVFEFVKDAYGRPYVPGSSVKGMLRTALLTCMILDDEELKSSYDGRLACSADRKKADKALVKKAFWLEHPVKNDLEIANDIMRYISVSDSDPLSCDGLVFAKKYDKFSRADDCSHKLDMGKSTDYEGNPLDVYRECLRPGTKVAVKVDVDSRIDGYLESPLDASGMIQILSRSYDLYKKCFLDCYDLGEDSANIQPHDGKCQYIAKSGPRAGMRCRNLAVGGTLFCGIHQGEAADKPSDAICYLGGGVDFDSKTVMNALFDDDDRRLSEIAHILYGQFGTRLDSGYHSRLKGEIEEAGFSPKHMDAISKKGKLDKAKVDHRHWRDIEFGVSPHTLKMGRIDGKDYPMGKCTVTVREIQ